MRLLLQIFVISIVYLTTQCAGSDRQIDTETSIYTWRYLFIYFCGSAAAFLCFCHAPTTFSSHLGALIIYVYALSVCVLLSAHRIASRAGPQLKCILRRLRIAGPEMLRADRHEPMTKRTRRAAHGAAGERRIAHPRLLMRQICS